MQTPTKKPLGVIDALAGGFELILQNPWVLLLPVLLDLFVWLGPQISIKPLFQDWLAWFNANAALPPNPSQEMQDSWAMFQGSLQSAGGSFNLFGVVVSGMPSLFWVAPPAEPARQILVELSDGLALVAALVPLALIGVFLTALYLELIGRAVRKETDWRSLAPRVLRVSTTIILFEIILLVGTLGFMFPLAIGTTVLLAVNQNLASAAVLLGMVAIIWLTLYLSFTLPAIVVSGAKAWQAIVNSIGIFRLSFPSAMGLIILIYLIHWGFGIVWDLFYDTPAGLVFDVIANAFLGSGLVAATMIFYADRMAWFNLLRERLQPQAQSKG